MSYQLFEWIDGIVEEKISKSRLQLYIIACTVPVLDYIFRHWCSYILFEKFFKQSRGCSKMVKQMNNEVLFQIAQETCPIRLQVYMLCLFNASGQFYISAAKRQ